jgi:hypothetical protein
MVAGSLCLFGVLVVTWWMVALLVLGIAVSCALPFAVVAAARRRSPTAPDAGTLVLRYPSPQRLFSICFAAGVLGTVTGGVAAYPPESRGDTVAVILIYVMFGGLAGVLVWECLRFRLVVGPDGIERRSPWRCRRLIRWAEVVSVSFSSPLKGFEVHTADGCAARLPAEVGDLEAFLEACERRLTPSQLEPARMAYFFLGRPFPEE